MRVALALQRDSERVARRAIQLANQHKAQLVCVHIVDDLLCDPGLPAFIGAATLADT